MSPKLGEVLVKTTHSKDIDDALSKIFSEYLELKLKTLVKSYFSCKKEKAWYHAVIVSFTFFFVTG